MNDIASLQYKKIYDLQFFYIVPILCIVFRVQGILGIIGLLSLLLIFSYMSYNVLLLFKSLTDNMSRSLFCGGVLFTAAGSILDMASTVICSPDLNREANYMVLMLLDTNVSLPLIYLFMFFFQILVSLLIIGLWGCFLKTYPKMMYNIPNKNPITTLKWFMGMGKCRFLDWIFFKKVEPYFSLSSTTVILLVMQLFHWYATLEWWGFIPISIEGRIITLGFALCLAISAIVIWTHSQLGRNKPILY